MKSLIFITKLLHSGIWCLFLPLLIALFLFPSFLFADQSTHTYDKQSIRYPSMDTGQIWAKSGATPSPPLKTDKGKILIKAGENSSSTLKINEGRGGSKSEENSSLSVTQEFRTIKNESASNTEIKKRWKLKRLKALRALENRNNQKTALHTLSSGEAGNKETPKTSTGTSAQLRKTVSSQGSGIEMSKNSKAGKNWHHKQDLYDVECGLKLARVVVTYYFDRRDTLVGSNISPDAQWYHIYPGSFEEKLYEEICHPR